MAAYGRGVPTEAYAIVPSDSATQTGNHIYVGGAGNVALIPADGSDAVTFVAPDAGIVLDIAFKKVMATGTTATSLVGMQ